MVGQPNLMKAYNTHIFNFRSNQILVEELMKSRIGRQFVTPPCPPTSDIVETLPVNKPSNQSLTSSDLLPVSALQPARKEIHCYLGTYQQYSEGCQPSKGITNKGSQAEPRRRVEDFVPSVSNTGSSTCTLVEGDYGVLRWPSRYKSGSISETYSARYNPADSNRFRFLTSSNSSRINNWRKEVSVDHITNIRVEYRESSPCDF